MSLHPAEPERLLGHRDACMSGTSENMTAMLSAASAALRPLCTMLADLQMAFRAMLESLQPPIGAQSEWPDVRRAVSLDESLRHVPEHRQVAIFDQLKSEAAERARLAHEQASRSNGGVGGSRGDEDSSTVVSRLLAQGGTEDDERLVLSTLRKEQARIHFTLLADVQAATDFQLVYHVALALSAAAHALSIGVVTLAALCAGKAQGRVRPHGGQAASNGGTLGGPPAQRHLKPPGRTR